MSNTSFSTLGLQPELLTNLDSLGYTQMTPIQALSLPTILAGKDVIGQGKTGSGKTAAFALGLLSNLNVKRFRVQTLVLCPTRELADQVAKEIRTIARTIHNILVDQARKNAAQKRQAELTTLDDVGEESAFEFSEQDQKMLDLGNALQQMEAEYPRQAQSMQLKYFGGLLVKEISDILAISTSSAEKDLAFAKSWLKLRLSS